MRTLSLVRAESCVSLGMQEEAVLYKIRLPWQPDYHNRFYDIKSIEILSLLLRENDEDAASLLLAL